MKKVLNFINFQTITVAIIFGWALITLNSCTKETEVVVSPDALDLETATASDRSIPDFYAVTRYKAGTTSMIVHLDDNTQSVLGMVPCVTTAGVAIPDLKGIALLNGAFGDYYVTTGGTAVNPVAYRNKLLKVDPNTGMVLSVITTTTPVGTISDICFVDFAPPGAPIAFYGLKNNTNTLARIQIGSWAKTSVPIVGLPAGYTCRGLTWTRCGNLFELYVVAASTVATDLVCKVDPLTGAVLSMNPVNPIADLKGGHCAAGWLFFSPKQFLVARRAAAFYGFNHGVFNCGAPVVSGLWGAQQIDFEDFCTIPY